MGVDGGDPAGQVMGFVDQKQGPSRFEAGLLIKKAAIGRRENVVVVGDPDVAEGEGGTGDFVGADRGGLAGDPQAFEVPGLIFRQVKTLESACGPPSAHSIEKTAGFAPAMKRVIDAMFRLRPHRPDQNAGRRRSEHRLQGADDLNLSGRLSGQIEHAIEISGVEPVEREFEQDSGFSETGRRLEENGGIEAAEGRGKLR